MNRKILVAGNWKMHKTTQGALAFASALKALKTQATCVPPVDIALIAPYTQLAGLVSAFSDDTILIGAQNMHYEESGAYTGEISPVMLAEIGVSYCVIGHSERRQYYAETDDTVRLKILAAIAHGISPIVCVGESLEQRDAGNEHTIIRGQLEKAFCDISDDDASECTIAYEPIWAIGTGRTASPEQAEDMCRFILGVLSSIYSTRLSDSIRVLYGGSVKSSNAAELFFQENIDGALVGGASLDPEEFWAIVGAALE